MPRIVLSIIVLSFLLTGCERAPESMPEPDFNKLDSYFANLAEQDKLSAAVLVTRAGETLFQSNHGFAAREPLVALNADSRFRIGSITKSYSAALIMKLVEQGKLSLDDTLDGFFPNVVNASQITVRHMLSHRSGIANYTDQADFIDYMYTGIEQAALLEKIESFPSQFAPGEQFSYSNSNYVLLGWMIEKLYGASFAQIIEDFIAQPLDLTQTRVGGPINASNGDVHSFSFENGRWQQQGQTVMDVPHAAGAITATASDVAKFYQALFDNRVVEQSSLSQMLDIKDGYGLGIFVLPFYQQRFYGHNGSIDGFVTTAACNQQDDVCVVVLSNGVNFPLNDALIATLSAVYGRDFDLPVASGQAISLDESAMGAYIGKFTSDDLPLELELFIDDGALMAQATGQGAFPLTAYSTLEFRFEPAGIVIKFDEDSLYPTVATRFVLYQRGGEFRYNLVR